LHERDVSRRQFLRRGEHGICVRKTGGVENGITAVNLKGVWNCMKHELLQMRNHGYLHVFKKNLSLCGPPSATFPHIQDIDERWLRFSYPTFWRYEE
jgi:hypothetical protein